MQSGSFWAFRDAAEIPDRDDGAPVWRTLSEKISTRRKGPILCTFCGDPINVGDQYRTVTALEDGAFVLIQQHTPSCPRFTIKERAELAAQFEADRAQFFPDETDARPVATKRHGNPAPDETPQTPIRKGRSS